MSEKKKGLKEIFAKFFENPTREAFRELMKNNTGEYAHLDFKGEWIEYDKLAKHILGMVNTKGGVIVVGVKENDDGTLESKGLSNLRDKTDILSPLKNYLPEKIEFNIHDFSFTESEYPAIKNKKFQVIIIEDTPEYIPFLGLKDGKNIMKNTIYHRGKTSTDEATYEQVQDILNRRIETQYSSRSVDNLSIQLMQLKELYKMIPESKSLYDDAILTVAARTKNPDYDLDDFIIKMIRIKKEIIEKMVRDQSE